MFYEGSLRRFRCTEDHADYIKLLSFLKPGHDELHFSSTSISNLKSQLEQHTALKCSSDSSRLIEYWVPMQLSSLQLEQYSSMLLSNSLPLYSGQKSNSVDALCDLIISTRKVDMIRNIEAGTSNFTQ
ncbi:uncharacterized protein LOC131633485 [Vicia villosa]|uniref:uncharacterized protein LOC131633485 n=1 Tax=Vicia villosa TaxID=3911 RepID=UPI00273C8B5D|nr:uncharacterized protein LOC131633485 [Vicia villosa]